MRIPIVIAFACTAMPLAHAECSVRSDGHRAHLVALYTSEGCSSCPPADRWLDALPTTAALVPLAFHVDYWDSVEWRDRFADPRFTERQRALANASGSTIVYTPEVAFDGHEWHDWSSDTWPDTTANSTPNLILHMDGAQPLRVHLDYAPASHAGDTHYRAYFAVSEDGLNSMVRGGENRGVRLHHDHVVRAFVGPLALDQAKATITLPTSLNRERAHVIAFVQRIDNGKVANVVQMSLTKCTASNGG